MRVIWGIAVIVLFSCEERSVPEYESVSEESSTDARLVLDYHTAKKKKTEAVRQKFFKLVDEGGIDRIHIHESEPLVSSRKAREFWNRGIGTKFRTLEDCENGCDVPRKCIGPSLSALGSMYACMNPCTATVDCTASALCSCIDPRDPGIAIHPDGSRSCFHPKGFCISNEEPLRIRVP